VVAGDTNEDTRVNVGDTNQRKSRRRPRNACATAPLGDTTGNGAVNSSDIGQAKSNSGQETIAANFRTDITVNGVINSSDIGTINAQSGTALP